MSGGPCVPVLRAHARPVFQASTRNASPHRDLVRGVGVAGLVAWLVAEGGEV
jgi:hypothetical protein